VKKKYNRSVAKFKLAKYKNNKAFIKGRTLRRGRFQ